jgi:hypothetical protein
MGVDACGVAGDLPRQVGDHGRRQFAPGWHLDPLDLVVQDLEQQTLRRLSRDQRRARLASSQEPLPAVGVKPGFQLALRLGVGGMAAVAILREHGTDLRLEEGELLR